ncbi:hypothetical protein RYH80_04995 [Halobaculum sp. MBLA0147]|uniref:DUF7511 domain-containing protein n=1 Tax=Halobaculum sp. MBLA0147 TaxID=3079934 RepID=UPI0035240519
MAADTDPVTGTTRSDHTADAADGDGALHSELVTYDEEPDRRTVFPAAADDDDLLTHWITANDGSFVDLRDLR